MKKLSLSFFLFLSYTCALLAQPMADFSVNTTTGCVPLAVDFTDLSTGSNLVYQWDFGDGTVATDANPTHFYLSETSYTVCLTVTDGSNGQSDTECKNNYIQIPNTNVTVDPTLCAEETFLLNGTLYDINNPSGTEVLVGASLNGCDSTVNVDLNFLPTEVTSLNFTACAGESVEVNGVIYDENNPTGTQILISTFGCDSLLMIAVDFAVPLTISTNSVMNSSCFGSADGSIQIMVTGGAGAYTYLWNNGMNTSVVSGLSAGVYQVTVVDNLGCAAVENFVITEPTPVVLDLNPPSALTCEMTAVVLDGVVSGGSAPYEYIWSTGATNDAISVTAPGMYSLTVTDANGCTTVSTIEVQGDLVSPVGAIIAPDPVCLGEQITVCYDPDMASSNFNYEWIGPNGFTANTDCFTLTLSDQSLTGCYTVTVTNAINGCTSEEVVCFPTFETYTINASTNTLCVGDSTQLFISPFPAGATVTWNTGLESLSCSDCPNPFAKPSFNTTYNATLVAQNGCIHLLSTFMEVDSNCVWPGDTDTNKVVNHFDLLAIGLSYDSIGPIRPNANIGWFRQPGPDWQQNTPGTNIDLKHVDTDGSGLINADDTMAISMNWGQVHLFRAGVDHQFTNNGLSSQSIATAPFYVEVDTFMEGEMLALPIVLGDMGVPLEDLYGLAFSIVYDSTIIEVSSVGVGFEDSWLGDIDDNMIAMQRDFYSPGKVNVAMTRIDGMPMAGFGEIARIYLTIQDDILLLGADTRSPIEGTAVEFEIADVLLINHLGEMISVDPMATTSLLTDLETSLDPEILDNSVRVYPNPAQEVIYIQSENIKLEKVSFFNLLGQKIKSLTIHSEQSIELMTDELVEGTYLLEIQTEGGRLTKRIVLSQ